MLSPVTLREVLAVPPLNSVDLGRQSSDQLESGIHPHIMCLFASAAQAKKVQDRAEAAGEGASAACGSGDSDCLGYLAPKSLLVPRSSLTGHRRYMTVCPRRLWFQRWQQWVGPGSRLLEDSLPSVMKGKHKCFQCFKAKGVQGPVVAARSFCDN